MAEGCCDRVRPPMEVATHVLWGLQYMVQDFRRLDFRIGF